MEHTHHDPPLFSDLELQIVEFMEFLRLSRLQPDPDPNLSPIPFNWASKRRRSSMDRSSSPPQTAKKVKVDGASSPATTLAFPPSESEEQLSNPLKITLSKLPKKIEGLKKHCDSLRSESEALLQEIAKIRIYRDKLKEEQFRLKEKLRVEKERPRLCLESEPIRFNMFTISNNIVHHHQQPLVVDEASTLLPSSSSAGGEGGLFDLNVVPAEAPASEEGFRAAEMAKVNRYNRKQKIQLKMKSKCGVGGATKVRVVR